MIRVIALVSLLVLAGCSTLRISGVGEVSLSVASVPDAPATATQTISNAFRTEASERGIAFEEGSTGNVRINAFITFAPSSIGTLVVYVLDFVDPAGNRLLRVSGQLNAPAAPASPWTVVDATLAASIADAALEEFEAWAAEN